MHVQTTKTVQTVSPQFEEIDHRKGRNTEIDLSSRQNLEKLYIYQRILEIGTLANPEIFTLTDI